MRDFLTIVFLLAGGYVLSIYTWSWLRSFFVSAKTQAQKLRAQAEELERRAKDSFKW